MPAETQLPLQLFVRRLQSTPVKGTMIHDLDSIDVTDAGIVGDRIFFVMDEHGKSLNGRELGALATLYSEYDAATQTLSIRIPDRDETVAVVEPCGAEFDVDFFSHTARCQNVEGPWHGALSEFFGRTLRLVMTTEPGAVCDRHHFSLVSSASLEFLAQHVADPAAARDSRRFRMMMEIEGCTAHQEDTWEGSVLDVGTARLVVLEAIPRCSVIRQDPSTGLKSVDLLRALNSYRLARKSAYESPIKQAADEYQAMLGRYARVTQPGRITVGDEIRLIS